MFSSSIQPHRSLSQPSVWWLWCQSSDFELLSWAWIPLEFDLALPPILVFCCFLSPTLLGLLLLQWCFSRAHVLAQATAASSIGTVVFSTYHISISLMSLTCMYVTSQRLHAFLVPQCPLFICFFVSLLYACCCRLCVGESSA